MQWELSTSRQSAQSELSAMPRGDLTKKLWNYIKKNKLQDEKKRTLINADEERDLRSSFGRPSPMPPAAMIGIVLRVGYAPSLGGRELALGSAQEHLVRQVVR